MNHKEELNLLKEQIALLKGNTTNEDVLEKINKTVERMEFSPLFKPYGLFFEDYKENEVEILNTHKLMPTQLDDLLIEKDLNKPVNLLLEGDNYQALKLLEKTHKEKIDVIYIDPPYNTGNKDFVYNDSYVNNEDAFRHSKWLSFMDKRLQIAKKLLSQDGIIYISIDDNEQSQLKMLCDQVFGEQNFASHISWLNNKKGRQMDKFFATTTDHILVYVKNKDYFDINLEVDFSYDLDIEYNLEDNISKYKRGVVLNNTNSKFNIITRPNLTYAIYYNPKTSHAVTLDEKYMDSDGNWVIDDINRYSEGYVKIKPPFRDSNMLFGCWRWGENKFNSEYKENIIFEENSKGTWMAYTKLRLDSDGGKVKKPKNYIDINGSQGRLELEDIFGDKIFDHPKPTKLIKWLLDRHSNKNAVVLDFFAGSGTTGHAVMELNKEDGGNRQFILATNNEVSPDKELQLLLSKGLVPQTPEVKKGQLFKEWKQAVSEFKETSSYQEFLKSDDYNNLGIARQVTYERLKRVINGYTTPKGKFVEGLPNNLKYIRLDKVTNLDAKKGVYSQKDAVFYFENVMEDLDAEYFKGESKDKVVYVVGDEEEIDNLLSELKNSTPDKEVFIYTNIVLINQYKQLEDGFTFKKFPKI